MGGPPPVQGFPGVGVGPGVWAAMLGLYEERLTDDDLDQLESLIERARKRGGAK